MSAWRSSAEFVAALADVRLPSIFNPYAEVCPDHDLHGAPEIRRENLQGMLEAAERQKIDVLWVGLELGRKGGRRTGLPLTDEQRLEQMAAYWGLTNVRRATSGKPSSEDSARFAWQAVSESPHRVLFWNVVPFQCHKADSANNRNHRPAEARAVAAFLPWILERYNPGEVVALGWKAEAALRRIGVPCRYVRHPAHQGGPTFLADIHGPAEAPPPR